METNEYGLTFSEFMEMVNEEIEMECGLSSDDLPDYLYYDAWKDCISPSEVAEEVIGSA